MKIVTGQVAVITGGGSGIGEALALACAERGMRVVVADIDENAAKNTTRKLLDLGVEALAVQVDVSSSEQIVSLADLCWQHFGACHLLCNNAGVSINKPLVDCNPGDWHWVMSVNALAVGYAINAFVPRMRQQEAGHIVNTASMAGLISLPHFGAYAASKYAVVAISEALAEELVAESPGVSILCPGVVNTRIYDSERNRPTDDCSVAVATDVGERAQDMQTDFADVYNRMLEPAEVADMVLRGVEENRLYLPTHPEWLPLFKRRSEAIEHAFSRG